MAYTKTTWVEGSAPGISAENLNKLETQYDEVKSEVAKTDGTSDIQVHGSNVTGNVFVLTSDYEDADVLAKIKNVDGAGSGLDADKLKGVDHRGQGGTSEHPVATTSVAGFMSAADKNRLDGGTITSGSVHYTDSIDAGSTLTKQIAIGSDKIRGKLTVSNYTTTETDMGIHGVMVFFNTDNLKTLAVGHRASPDVSAAAISRAYLGKITVAGSSSGFGRKATGHEEIRINEIYISGSNLVIEFENTDTAAQSLNCQIDWEVE